MEGLQLSMHISQANREDWLYSTARWGRSFEIHASVSAGSRPPRLFQQNEFQVSAKFDPIEALVVDPKRFLNAPNVAGKLDPHKELPRLDVPG